MKPELQAAIERVTEIVQRSTWHQETLMLMKADVEKMLAALKPQNPGIAVPKPEVHGSLNIKTFTPPEDFLEQIHETAVKELLEGRS